MTKVEHTILKNQMTIMAALKNMLDQQSYMGSGLHANNLGERYRITEQNIEYWITGKVEI